MTNRSYQNQTNETNYFEGDHRMAVDMQEKVNAAVRGINQKLKNPYQLDKKSYYDQTEFIIKDTFIANQNDSVVKVPLQSNSNNEISE